MPEPLPSFVERRRPSWARLDELVSAFGKRQLPLGAIDELEGLYRLAAADLAKAQAFYPGSDVQRFLTALCGRAYTTIYRPARRRWQAVQTFYRVEFPQALRAHLHYVGVAAGLLALGAVLGALTLWLEPATAERWVPAHLQKFVSEGRLWTDPLLDYSAPSALATQIMLNNLRVIFMAFALGVTFGLGTVTILLFNGFSLGAIFTYCANNKLGLPLFTFIAAHGWVELSVIAIAGGAGLMIGHALIEPGEQTRGERLSQVGTEAARLLLGAAPFMALIGIVEGFISPGTLFPLWVKAPLGVALGAALWAYLLRAGRKGQAITVASRNAR
ncbi:MAG: stage II sporulation protein M [Myxococcaceae bacterium]|nr:stage II sporulation protein M [Myxococcaceae bacterium]